MMTHQDENKVFVAVAGNIGVGKTTLTNKLSGHYGWKPLYESVEDNPYLVDFYSDMERYSFPLQVFFLNHRFNAHRDIKQGHFSAIQDRTIYEDANIFARNLCEIGKMSERDFKTYLDLYNTMISFLNPPDLMIFLRRSIPKLVERIQLRNRECEKKLSLDYLERLNSYYHDWFNGYNLGRCIVVDTDDTDFLSSESDFNSLIKMIDNATEQQDMFIHLNSHNLQ